MPRKYIVTCTLVQRTGAGLHTETACYWDPANATARTGPVIDWHPKGGVGPFVDPEGGWTTSVVGRTPSLTPPPSPQHAPKREGSLVPAVARRQLHLPPAPGACPPVIASNPAR